MKLDVGSLTNIIYDNLQLVEHGKDECLPSIKAVANLSELRARRDSSNYAARHIFTFLAFTCL